MGKWFAGGANKITLGRIPCMLLVVFCVFYQGRTDVRWYWLGALALTIGMILDWADGYWARNMSRPTTEGQFLDQFIDKWGFVYPLLAVISITLWDRLWVGWYPLVGVMLILDIRSCLSHYRNYCVAHRTGQFDPDAGANWFGKIKFASQNVALCFIIASLCPPIVGDRVPILAWCSDAIGWIGRTFFVVGYLSLAVSIALALKSLHKRGTAGWRKIMRQLSATPL